MTPDFLGRDSALDLGRPAAGAAAAALFLKIMELLLGRELREGKRETVAGRPSLTWD